MSDYVILPNKTTSGRASVLLAQKPGWLLGLMTEPSALPESLIMVTSSVETVGLLVTKKRTIIYSVPTGAIE